MENAWEKWKGQGKCIQEWETEEDVNVKRGVMLQLDNVTITHHALCKRTMERLAGSLMVT